jgi:lysozyme family protein
MRETLPLALKLMFGHEGGYSNRKTDAGGPTRYGVTFRTLAAERGISLERAKIAVRDLTLSEAELIYRKSYWAQSGGDTLPKGLDYMAFDFGVNSGPHRAIRTLQEVLGVAADGWVGAITLRAIDDYPGGIVALLHAYTAARMKFLENLKSHKTGFPVNGRGWTIRVTGIDPKGEWAPQPGVIGHALAMVGGDAPSASAADAAHEGGDSKAVPAPENPWFKPEVILPGAGGLLGGAGTLFSGTGPVQIAFAVAIIVAVVVGAFLVVRHLKDNPK